ncbi:MAG: outer membrane protein [Bacteroidetes bacterium]|nr:outer membrane protein [Bacteroidota bacterium]MDF2452989.1 outer membrane protein [Bacteroidota bacterium]
MRKIKFLLSIFMFFIVVTTVAQNKDTKEEAAYYFDQKDYKKAYELYDKLYSQVPKNFEYKFRLGYSSLFYPEKKARAIEIFEDIKRTDKSPDVDYYLAKSYHVNYRFDDAIVSYEAFIAAKNEKATTEDLPFIDDSKLGIENCKNGKELIAKKIIADIKNIGGPINTDEIEGVPVISADESVMIFTYVGKKSTGGLLNDFLKPDTDEGTFHEDIFISTRSSDSSWNAPVGINSLNTNGNDAAVALSPDGQTLFSFVSDVKNPGDLYFSSLSGMDWTKPEKLNSNINSEFWEGSCSITSDGRYLFFASERPGGLGGRDLYLSEKVNGDWGPAVNLGPSINTQYNEDAPFIHPDGITLFFSSEGHKSIGGYDIMYSIKKENSWIEPLSMGIPLNTTEDDRYYVINAKGDVGYFSSNRGGTGGKGQQDIYMVTPGILGEKPILALLKGSVFVNDKPSEAKIEVIKKGDNTVIGPYYANSKSGKYLMAISPGSGYIVKITVEGMDVIEEEIDVEKLQKFVEIKKDFYLYTPGFESKKNQISVKTILDSLLNTGTNAETFKNDANVSNVVNSNLKETDPVTTTPAATLAPCNGGVTPDFSQVKGKSLNDAAVYKKFMEIGGKMCADGLVFKIQIAAYKHPENYKYGHLKQFGAPEIVNYPDGITRFTQLSFSTLNEAEKARQKIIGKGQKDAWITAFIDGKRFTLEELILVNFVGKAIN